MISVLEVGEIMQDGDEWYDDASGQGGGKPDWYPVRAMVGLPVAEGILVRRPSEKLICPQCGPSVVGESYFDVLQKRAITNPDNESWGNVGQGLVG